MRLFTIAIVFAMGCSSPPAKEPNASPNNANAVPNNANANPNNANANPNNINAQNSSSPTFVNANDFDQSCQFDYDCALVWGGDVCGCGAICADAIAESAVEDFEAAIAAITCAPNADPIACPGAACQEQMPVCSSGTCAAAFPRDIEASEFDQACEVDTDCTLVSTGTICNACDCGRGAISVNAVPDYEAARNEVDCNPGPSPCDCQEWEPAWCNDGVCAGGSN